MIIGCSMHMASLCSERLFVVALENPHGGNDWDAMDLFQNWHVFYLYLPSLVGKFIASAQ